MCSLIAVAEQVPTLGRELALLLLLLNPPPPPCPAALSLSIPTHMRAHKRFRREIVLETFYFHTHDDTREDSVLVRSYTSRTLEDTVLVRSYTRKTRCVCDDTREDWDRSCTDAHAHTGSQDSCSPEAATT